jgi:CheY-like chemotaxis protein
MGFSELVRRSPGLSEEQNKNLEAIGRSGQHLLSLINDVLEVSKIEAGRAVLNPQDFNFHQLLQVLEEMFKLRARQKDISLDIVWAPDVPEFVHGDQKKLRQILINLLENAVKFTETGGVRLSVEYHQDKPGESDGARLGFKIFDTGCGISKQDQVYIFDAFYQSNSEPSPQQGTGLGLPISRKFVELMGGTLEVDSQVGKGTSFTFDIRIAPSIGEKRESHGNRRKVTGLAPGQFPFRMLVAEDDENNRKFLIALLQSVGFETMEASNGSEAIMIWRQWHPHLIWMDIRMPVMNGHQATAAIRSEIRQTDPERDTKIIALTANAFEAERFKVIEYGGTDYLSKPFEEWEIFEMIKKHLDVIFIYDEKDKEHIPRNLNGRISNEKLITLLSTLSGELIVRLKEVTELSDAVMIEAAIEEVRVEHVQLAKVLSKLAENYAYDRILALVQQAEEMAAKHRN